MLLAGNIAAEQGGEIASSSGGSEAEPLAHVLQQAKLEGADSADQSPSGLSQ